MKHSFILSLLFAGLALQALPAKAQTADAATASVEVQATTDTAPVDERLAAFEAAKGTAVGGKQGEKISAYMLTQAQRFKSIAGATVSVIRDGEVIKVSVPAEKLFAPNDTALIGLAPKPHKGHLPPDYQAPKSTPAAPVDAWLRPILTFMRKGYTDLIVTSHTDNNGSPAYLARISNARGGAVEHWFAQNGIPASSMSRFAFTDERPLYDNDSMLRRAQNRRITFYLVPNAAMIKEAKKRRAFQE